jgi:hypothetical protein
MAMTLEQLLRTGEEPAPFMAKYPEEYGGNYLTTVEVIHQLHCIVSRNRRLLDLYSPLIEHGSPIQLG